MVSRAGLVVRANASQLSARADTTSTPPNDLTQALAVAGFLAVRYGSFNIDAGLLLKSLAALQLLVAAVALVTRGVHTDRVRMHTKCPQQTCCVKHIMAARPFSQIS